jgi:hypothetical protein
VRIPGICSLVIVGIVLVWYVSKPGPPLHRSRPGPVFMHPIKGKFHRRSMLGTFQDARSLNGIPGPAASA